MSRNNRGILVEAEDAYDDDEVLDCGKPVNFTYYDHLVGIQNRASHLHIPEPEVQIKHSQGTTRDPPFKKLYSHSYLYNSCDGDILAFTPIF